MMAIAWLIYILGILIFISFGGIGVYHARKYGLPGDFSSKGAKIYLTIVVIILVVSIILIFLNGPMAPIELSKVDAYLK